MIKRTLAILLFTFTAYAAPRCPLAGTWTLTGADEIRPDGSVAEPYSSEPAGLLIIDNAGRYSLQIFHPGHPKFASGDKRKGTPQEYEGAVMGMSSHIGRITVDRATETLTFQIDRAAYPNWDGTVQKRHYHLAGDDLSYEIPASAANGIIPRSRWRRIR
ncbi:MAG: hypothetical protein QOH21_395 [Acidobacteriota bacterium]|jgi:hypothetical protein|nr:hypothetical protein [Acidobacteriota bacterium]